MSNQIQMTEQQPLISPQSTESNPSTKEVQKNTETLMTSKEYLNYLENLLRNIQKNSETKLVKTQSTVSPQEQQSSDSSSFLSQLFSRLFTGKKKIKKN